MSDSEMLSAWQLNASSWTQMVRGGKLVSRTEVTNQAVIDALGAGEGRSILDLGCGEGWLTHRLCETGWRAVGVDAVAALVLAAREGSGPGEFLMAGYEALDDALSDRRFDAVVANFSLLGEQSVTLALATARRRLTPEGRLVIQTLHPGGVTPYVDGWRSESWAGYPLLDCAPSPWYFRTLAGWHSLLVACGFRLLTLTEPRGEGAAFPSSLLLVAESA